MIKSRFKKNINHFLCFITNSFLMKYHHCVFTISIAYFVSQPTLRRKMTFLSQPILIMWMLNNYSSRWHKMLTTTNMRYGQLYILSNTFIMVLDLYFCNFSFRLCFIYNCFSLQHQTEFWNTFDPNWNKEAINLTPGFCDTTLPVPTNYGQVQKGA